MWVDEVGCNRCVKSGFSTGGRLDTLMLRRSTFGAIDTNLSSDQVMHVRGVCVW